MKTAEPKNLIFLGMNSKTAMAVTAARPELQSLKDEMNGGKTFVRKLGTNGDPEVKQATQDDFNNAIVVGFSIPVNVAAKAFQVIEIPVSNKHIERRVLADALDEAGMQNLAKALTEMVNIPLKVIRTTVTTLTNQEAGEEFDF